MIADKTYHLSKDGKAVSEDDTAGVSVLVAKGGFISDADAKKYGITGGIEAADTKAAAAYTAGEQEKRNVATIEDPRLREMLQATPREAVMGGDGARAIMVTTAETGKPSEGEPVTIRQDEPRGEGEFGAKPEGQDVIAPAHTSTEKKPGGGR